MNNHNMWIKYPNNLDEKQKIEVGPSVTFTGDIPKDGDSNVDVREFTGWNTDRVTISMGIDPGLTERIADVVERKVTDEMKANVYDLIMKKTSYYNPRYSDAKKYNLQDWVVEEIKNVILENKEEIIQAAAEKLADSMRRSKPVRERFCDILEEEMNS